MKQRFTIFKAIAFACVILLSSFSPIKKYLKKAEKELDNGHISECKAYYQKVLDLEPDNYQANLGMGLVLCELEDNYNSALIYLEKACKASTKDTLTDLKFALGKCYQIEERYSNARYYYKRLDGLIDYDNEIDFTGEIRKRLVDCDYAENRKDEKPSSNEYVVNAGKRINTSAPEYVPIIAAQNGLIFTSKRQDSKEETINYMDGKYFESIYISQLDSNKHYKSTRYNGLDKALHTRFGKKHESLLSLTSNGNKWFVFADNKIYEIEIDGGKVKSVKKLGKSINFNEYQNHAFLTQDGKNIYFTSDAGGGKGGNDIYYAKRDSIGEWGKPINLGDSINTPFDEEAPFLSTDEKTLYFSSKGHPGYGNFDMYKCELRNGKWSAPVNLGKPYNSSANDLFFVCDSSKSYAYFSSARKGGFGDMDIYKIIYIDKIDTKCNEGIKYPVLLSVVDENKYDYANTIESKIPSNYNIVSYDWKVDNAIVSAPINALTRDYVNKGSYQIDFKLVALCDTCIMPVVSCSGILNNVDKAKIEVIVSATTAASNSVASIETNKTETLANNTGTTTNAVNVTSDNNNQNVNEKEIGVASSNSKASETKTNTPVGSETSNANNKVSASNEGTKSFSNGIPNDVIALGFNSENILYSSNSSELNAKALDILSNNAKILTNNPKLKVEILGYADPKGPLEYNKVLSNDRAHVIWVYLIKHGVKRYQITNVKGMGPLQNDGTCGKDKDCIRKQNEGFRRAVFNIVSK